MIEVGIPLLHLLLQENNLSINPISQRFAARGLTWSCNIMMVN